jgi:hypothetical protein
MESTGCSSASPLPPAHLFLEAPWGKGTLPAWAVLLGSMYGEVMQGTGQLRMEIPLVFSHGQQGLFRDYIQLKIDFSV